MRTVVLILTQAHIKTMQAHAEQAYPREGCGLLIGEFNLVTDEKTLVHLSFLDNAWTAQVADDLEVHGHRDSTAMDQTRRYWIDPKDLLMAQRQARADGLTIIGVYHSHPEAEALPSECDRRLAWPTYAYIIVSVCNGVAVNLKNWQLDSHHQFQPEPMKIVPASAARDRMPILSS
ncbi:MAG: M67 family metallopeptidase [Symploca sp. SIO2G7]|nr:M67 family metallopeptidase [Symploca sp. SIO2G7]